MEEEKDYTILALLSVCAIVLGLGLIATLVDEFYGFIESQDEIISAAGRQNVNLSCSICPTYEKNSDSCAEAGDFGKCMIIKMGAFEASNAENLCDINGGTLSGYKASWVTCTYFPFSNAP